MTFQIDRTISLNSPFAIIEKSGRVTCYQGNIHTLSCLDDIHDLAVREGRDVVFALPYHAIRERGFEAVGDEPILAMSVTASITLDKAELINRIPDVPIELDGEIAPSMSDNDYCELVKAFQKNEIGGGNASQVTLSRRFEGRVKGLDINVLFSVYRKLLLSRGQYMTILFANIDAANPKESQFLVGATPERHIEVAGNETIMIPIAGTLRKEDRETFEIRLGEFLANPKEINELFQVVDEEMKIMGVVSPEGGEVHGPYLREIGAVVHTEYELVGRRSMNSIDALRRAMHAPTVVGSPMQSAARIIAKYEKTSRRYYAGEVGVYYAPRLATHRPNVYGDIDTAILIRTAEMFGDGRFYVQAGGGLVRDSIPEEEAKETRAKAMGMIGVMTGSTITSDEYLTPALRQKYEPLLAERNKLLSDFWMQKQNPYQVASFPLKGKTVAIINNEDDFALMIGHMMKSMGATVSVVDTFDFTAQSDNSDLVILGPGPGDPTDMAHPRMKRLQDMIAVLKQSGKPLLGICLGHQALAVYEGLDVLRQAESTQGLQREVPVFGRSRRLGFYNSFSPLLNKKAFEKQGMEFDCDENDRIIAMRGLNFVGFQFHPESVMSQDGSDVMVEALRTLKLIIA